MTVTSGEWRSRHAYMGAVNWANTVIVNVSHTQLMIATEEIDASHCRRRPGADCCYLQPCRHTIRCPVSDQPGTGGAQDSVSARNEVPFILCHMTWPRPGKISRCTLSWRKIGDYPATAGGISLYLWAPSTIFMIVPTDLTATRYKCSFGC